MVSKNKRNLLLQIAITVVVLTMGTIFFLKYETEHIRLDKYDDLDIVATLKTEELSNCISKEFAYAELLSRNFFMRDRVEKYLLYGSARIKKDFSNYFKDILKSHRYKNILITSAGGNVLVSGRNSNSQLEQALISAIQKSVKSKTTVSTDLFFSDSQKSISFDIVTPLADDEGRIKAVLVLREDVDSLIYSVINTWPVESKSGECMIVERDGNYVRFLSNLKFLKNTALKRRILLSETKVPAVQAVKGKVGIFEGIDYRGVDVIADLHPVPGTNWFMVCKLDKDEVLEELNYRKTLSVILIFILFFFAISSFALVHYSRSRKHYMQLYEKEKEIRAANEKFRTTLYSIGEGVITTDTEANIKQINHVAEELTGWEEKEAIGKTIHEVFTITNRNSGNNEENPVESVIKAGDIIVVTNQTTLISRNGSKYQIAIIAAPIKERDGNISGAVLAFRDQTEEYNSQLRLAENERKFKMIFEMSPDAITITKLADGKLIEFNKGFCALTGFTREEVLGKTASDLGIWLHPSEREKLVKELCSNEMVHSMEMNLHRKDGSILACYLSACIVDIQGENIYWLLTGM